MIKIDQKAQVVIIGGGPVGLWTAIQIRLLSRKKVVVIEKYETYQRSDIHLRIKAASLQGIPNNNDLKKLVKQWGNKIVPVKEMEDKLIHLAHQIGIKILKGEAADPKKLPSLFPNAKLFIGADGSKSLVRKIIFKDLFRFHSNLQYMAQVQYVVKPKLKRASQRESPEKIQSIRNLSTTYKRQKLAEHFLIETTHPQLDGSARVTLQIFIDKKTHDQIAGATFRNPYYFETSLKNLPKPLKKLLIGWWGAQKELQGREISPNKKSNKLTVVALNSYAAKEFVTVDQEGRLWALVGDAAAAVPFFRAVNNGFMLGTKLAKCTAEGLKDNSLTKSHLTSYSRYATYRVTIERIRAWIKSLFITIAGLWLKVSNSVPWQTIRLTSSEKRRIKVGGSRIWRQLISGTS